MKTAHWILRTHLFRRDEYICSACKVSCDKPYTVCPSCGIPMIKTRYEPSWVDEAEELSAIMDDDW